MGTQWALDYRRRLLARLRRLTGTVLDRLAHHVHILEMNGDSFRLKQSKRRTQLMLSPPTLAKSDL